MRGEPGDGPMRGLRRALDISEAVVTAFCAACFAAMVALGVATVVFRFLIQSSLAFPDELIRYLFIWLIAIGSAVAFRRNLHAAIGAGVALLPPAPRRAAVMVSTLLSIGFFALVLYYGVLMTMRVAPQISPALQVSMAWIYAAAPAGAALMLVYAVEVLVDQARAPADALADVGG
jgi:TRAP-type C4-dicarboxylate transport system permease small subunit